MQTPMPSSSPSGVIATGALLHNRYRVVAVAGQGRIGQTYLVRDQTHYNELCVLKEFIPSHPRSPEDIQARWQQFEQSVAPLFRLQHSQLPRFQTAMTQDDRLYWVREYVEGKSYGVLLDERRAEGLTFREVEVMQLMAQVLPVLDFLHQQGIVHGNIHPDSLILRQKDQLPVLIGFGMVNELVAELELHPIDPADALGRWGYVPPEQIEGNPYPGSDLYALAVTAIVLLAGKEPEELYDPDSQIFSWQQQINPTFAQLLGQMLTPDPQQRLGSALEVLHFLRPLLLVSTPSPAAAPAAPPPPPPVSPEPPPTKPSAPMRGKKPARRKPPRTDLTASLAMAAGLALLVAVVSWRVLTAVRPSPQSQTPVVEAPASSIPPVETSESPAPEPTQTAVAPEAAPGSPDALRDRRRSLGVDYAFFTALVDEQFYAKYPQYRSQKLGADGAQDTLRNEWNAIGSEVLTKLESLRPESRRKLGSYNRASYDALLAQLGETGANSKALDSLADDRLFKLFPELRGKAMNPRTYGQVWYALAEEEVGNAKAKKAL